MSEVAVITNQYHYATYMSMADLYPIAHRQLSNNAQMALQRKLEQARDQKNKNDGKDGEGDSALRGHDGSPSSG